MENTEIYQIVGNAERVFTHFEDSLCMDLDSYIKNTIRMFNRAIESKDIAKAQQYADLIAKMERELQAHLNGEYPIV